MIWLGRARPEPRALPERTPHPDSRVEAELQRVLAMQRSAARTEQRLAAITGAQAELDHRRRAYAEEARASKNLSEQADDLRRERGDLEDRLGTLHDAISKRLADLGEDALMLYGQS